MNVYPYAFEVLSNQREQEIKRLAEYARQSAFVRQSVAGNGLLRKLYAFL